MLDMICAQISDRAVAYAAVVLFCRVFEKNEARIIRKDDARFVIQDD